MNINSRIKKCKEELIELEEKNRYFRQMQVDYLTGRRNIRLDYPCWTHPFHRTPMAWIVWTIRITDGQIESKKDELMNLYRKRSWLESDYYCLDFSDICEHIHKDGFITGTKF